MLFVSQMVFSPLERPPTRCCHWFGVVQTWTSEADPTRTPTLTQAPSPPYPPPSPAPCRDWRALVLKLLMPDV